MIVDYLNIVRGILQPPKADTKLVVYPNAELTDSRAPDRLQAIPRRNPQVIK
jgi:hypothetical protein